MVQAGGGFIGGVNSGEAYVRIAPHEERLFSLDRLWRETLALHALARVPGQLQRSAT